MSGSLEVRCPRCGRQALASPSKGLWCPSCARSHAEARQERAAILEYDAGHSREKSERIAGVTGTEVSA
jgi:ribosomal protein L37AE/L43A